MPLMMMAQDRFGTLATIRHSMHSIKDAQEFASYKFGNAVHKLNAREAASLRPCSPAPWSLRSGE